MRTTTQILEGVASGIVDPDEAIEALHMNNRAELLNALADRHLPPPKPPKEQVEAELAAAMPLLLRMEAARIAREEAGSDGSHHRNA